MATWSPCASTTGRSCSWSSATQGTLRDLGRAVRARCASRSSSTCAPTRSSGPTSRRTPTGTGSSTTLYLLIAATAVVTQFLATFKEFPPRQKAASFTIDQVVEKLEAVITSGHWRPRVKETRWASRAARQAASSCACRTIPERVHMGELPANVDVRARPARARAAAGSRRGRAHRAGRTDPRRPLLELLAGGGGRLRVIQTLSAGVDWLIGRVPEHVIVCNARGVYDAPLAEWVVGAILAMQRGLVQSRDAQARHELGRRSSHPSCSAGVSSSSASGRSGRRSRTGCARSASRWSAWVGPRATACAAWPTSTTSSATPRSSWTCSR